jgi:hypothetical protein
MVGIINPHFTQPHTWNTPLSSLSWTGSLLPFWRCSPLTFRLDGSLPPLQGPRIFPWLDIPGLGRCLRSLAHEFVPHRGSSDVGGRLWFTSSSGDGTSSLQSVLCHSVADDNSQQYSIPSAPQGASKSAAWPCRFAYCERGGLACQLSARVATCVCTTYPTSL